MWLEAIAWLSAISHGSPTPRAICPGVIISLEPEALVIWIIRRAWLACASAKMAGSHWPQALNT